MGKADYNIKIVHKAECVGILNDYHYLTGISKGFKSGENYGLYKKDVLCGVCIFTGFPVPELVVGCFGLDRNDQEGFWELSRLVLLPGTQNTEHNIASWFVSRAMRLLRKARKVRAILSYADNEYHSGTVYAALNFKYYGLTKPKKDFWIERNGTYFKHSRGKTKGIPGEWRARTRKHRFLIVYEKALLVNWDLERWRV